MNENKVNLLNPDFTAMFAAEIRAILADIPVGAVFELPPSARLCASLELLIPHVLSIRYSQWKGESLDGVFVARAVKTGPMAAEIVGTCILSTDQTVTPFLVEVSLTLLGESIASFRACVGESGSGRLGISGPKCNSFRADRLWDAIKGRLAEICCSYTIAIEMT